MPSVPPLALSRVARLLLAGLAVAAGLLAGSAAPSATAAPKPAAAGFEDASAYPPIARLGRWDGETFRPVRPGSIDGSRATFITHGWATGLLDAYERLQASSDALVTAWARGMDQDGTPFVENFVGLARALQAADPRGAVVLFSWVDQAATTDDPLTARDARAATEVNGHRMAIAIDEALSPAFRACGGEVHVIGHSFGSSVATTAALALRQPPRQLTVLDSPENAVAWLDGAANELQDKLPRLTPGRGPGQTFVDSYVSAVGEPYSGRPALGEVVDVRTRPPHGAPALGHLYAIDWYAASARRPRAGVGYGWSPLRGADVRRLGSRYEQRAVGRPLDLERIAPAPRAGEADELAVETEDVDLADGRQVTVDRARPAASFALETDDRSLWLELDLALRGRPTDLVTVAVDGRARYQAAVGGAGTGRPGAFVELYDLAPGRHRVTVALSDAAAGTASPRTSARLGGWRLASTPGLEHEPTAEETDAVLIAVAAAVVALLGALAVVAWRLLRRLRRPRHRRG